MTFDLCHLLRVKGHEAEWGISNHKSMLNLDFRGQLIIIIIIIWFGDTVTVSHFTKCNTNSKVRCSVVSTLNRIDVFLSALQKSLN